MNSQAFRVQGMTCGGCAKHVEKALWSVAGVTGVVVDVSQGTATVEGDASLESMAACVAKAGYELLGPA